MKALQCSCRHLHCSYYSEDATRLHCSHYIAVLWRLHNSAGCCVVRLVCNLDDLHETQRVFTVSVYCLFVGQAGMCTAMKHVQFDVTRRLRMAFAHKLVIEAQIEDKYFATSNSAYL